MAPTPPSPNSTSPPQNPPSQSAPPRPAALPYLTVANARDAIAWYVDAFGASVVGEPFEMDDGRIGHAELAIAGGVLYLADEYPEIGLKAPDPQATSVSLMLHVADTDATLERARDRGAQVQREPYENYGVAQRHDRRPVRASLDAQRTGDRRRDADPARGRRLRLGVDARRRPRRGVLRSCARVDIRPGDPSGHQHHAAHRDLQRRQPAALFCCYAVADLAGRAPVDPGRRRHSRRTAGVRLRHGAGCHRPAGHGVRGVPAGAGDTAPSAQWQWARRTFVHHVRGDRLDGVQGVLQPRAVLDLRARPHRRRLAEFSRPIRWPASRAAAPSR